MGPYRTPGREPEPPRLPGGDPELRGLRRFGILVEASAAGVCLTRVLAGGAAPAALALALGFLLLIGRELGRSVNA